MEPPEALKVRAVPNTACTVFVLFIVNTRTLPLVEASPVQPREPQLLLAVAVRVTTVLLV
jgi:hypothetical protein